MARGDDHVVKLVSEGLSLLGLSGVHVILNYEESLLLLRHRFVVERRQLYLVLSCAVALEVVLSSEADNRRPEKQQRKDEHKHLDAALGGHQLVVEWILSLAVEVHDVDESIAYEVDRHVKHPVAQ